MRRFDNNWMQRARCRALGPDLFFPATPDDPSFPVSQKESQRRIAEAREVCRGCPVRAECLREAMSYPWGSHGVWGGTTEHERKQMRRQPGWREAVGA